MLEIMHAEVTGEGGVGAPPPRQPAPPPKPSLAHTCFGCDLTDQWKCLACGATTSPASATHYVYRIYVTEVSEGARE